MRSATSSPHPSESNGNTSAAPPFVHPQINTKYNIGRKLGRGCFASVYKAEHRLNQLPVAIKVIDKNRLDEETASLLQNELQILQAVSEHPGIVKLLDYLETDAHMYFVMEFVDGGPLLDRIVSRGTFSENDARIMIRTILHVLQFLSKLGFVHRDIKPENILVDNRSKSWPVKLTDFGLSAKIQPDKLLRGALGTPLFVAPEILIGNGYDCSCDTWSLGVVLYIVLCGFPPFPYDSPASLVSSIIACDYSFAAPEWHRVSSDAKDFLSRMLEADPSKRMSPIDALNHPWITVAQSTSELPNSNLRKFNARRKLKAIVFGVLTTFEIRKIMGASNNGPQTPASQRALIRDVERNRDLIQKMGILDDSPQVESGSAPETEQPKLKPSRRSLVLPMNMLDSASAHNSPVPDATQSAQRFYEMSDSGILDSQVMQSRTLAMVAEVKDSSALNDTPNPFMVGPDSGSDSEGEETGSSGPSLPVLDFRSLGIS